MPPEKTAIKIFYTWEAVNADVELYDLSIGFNLIEYPKNIRITL